MIFDKKILITGGTGSLGAILTKALAKKNQIVVYSRNEERQFNLQQELREYNISFIIGDVRDTETLEYAMRTCDYAIHAAAMKDVIMCEKQPIQTYLNNIEGSRSFLKAADRANIIKAVGISTDKAASPSNVYGMTKYIMEKLFMEYSRFSKTIFCTTRFGNMIDSKGSMITYWKNNPTLEVKLTHNDMERFFFTVQDAVYTVIQTFEQANSGDILIPKMKKAKIKEILTVITGKKEFEIMGLFPGEKIYEELIGDYEKYFTEEYNDYFIVNQDTIKNENTTAYSTMNAENMTSKELKQMIYGN